MPPNRALARTSLAASLVIALGGSGAVSLASVAPSASVGQALGDQRVAPAGRSRGKWHWNTGERCMMRLINRQRARRGLKRLRWDRQLSFVGRKHAKAMAATGRGIWHDPYLYRRVTNWKRIGQNTGAGARCHKLFWTFWRSPAHRRNILSHWSYVGVGSVLRRGRGLYVQQIFESSRNPGNVFRSP